MKTHIFWGLLLLAGGCVANAQTNAPGNLCSAGKCYLKITVATATDGSCSLSIDQPDLYVAQGIIPVLIWKIDPTTYSFDDPGIVFDNDPPQFSHPIKTEPYEIWVIDAHTSMGKFKYSVHVKKPGTNPEVTCKLDPYIHNN